jgi:hypothetical protein
MQNIDGSYASKDVKIGEIVLTEDELPDCSLPRYMTFYFQFFKKYYFLNLTSIWEFVFF